MKDLRAYEGYFFDLDGTMLLGGKLLPGAKQTVRILREHRKKLLFLTNSTTRTREECYQRLLAMGLEVEKEEVITAGFLAALYLSELEDKPQVYVVGEPSLCEELTGLGVDITTQSEQATHVLVGMDTSFNYKKLHQAAKAVRSGAVLIAGNPDANCPIENDWIPDTLPLLRAIETAGEQEAHIVIGKPSSYFSEKTLGSCGLSPDRCLMVGDRLDTDIAFGARHGLSTALVLTGVAAAEDLETSEEKPDYVLADLHPLADAFLDPDPLESIKP